MNIDIYKGPVWQKIIQYLELWKNDKNLKTIEKKNQTVGKTYISSP